METLLATPSIEQYTQLRLQKAKLGRRIVKVTSVNNSGRSGSWMRGFKFSDITYGVLVYKPASPAGVEPSYSMNHGVTWHPTLKEAQRSKGKVILSRSKYSEFAFEGIQDINKKYDPNYKWKP